MFITNEDGLFIDIEDRRPVATFADSFVTSLGTGAQASIVILRLHRKGERSLDHPVPHDRVHQFALPAHRAAELGRHLLELAAQAEKESTHPREN